MLLTSPEMLLLVLLYWSEAAHIGGVAKREALARIKRATRAMPERVARLRHQPRHERIRTAASSALRHGVLRHERSEASSKLAAILLVRKVRLVVAGNVEICT